MFRQPLVHRLETTGFSVVVVVVANQEWVVRTVSVARGVEEPGAHQSVVVEQVEPTTV
jgi:hypothetical protein